MSYEIELTNESREIKETSLNIGLSISLDFRFRLMDDIPTDKHQVSVFVLLKCNDEYTLKVANYLNKKYTLLDKSEAFLRSDWLGWAYVPSKGLETIAKNLTLESIAQKKQQIKS
jgi:hypothetical protein